MGLLYDNIITFTLLLLPKVKQVGKYINRTVYADCNLDYYLEYLTQSDRKMTKIGIHDYL